MSDLRDGVRGDPPLLGRLEPWMDELLTDSARCTSLVELYGSPVNVIDPRPLQRNADELVSAGRAAGVEVGLFFARKANKALALVDEVVRLGHGVDVGSEPELRQVLQRGVPGERIILTAAVKPLPLLRLALEHGVTVSLDAPAEAATLDELARRTGTIARVAPRLAPPPGLGLPPSRFGDHTGAWAELPKAGSGLDVVGVHFHLHGYRADDRARMVAAAIDLVNVLRGRGHRPGFVDIGGGVPMSYLDDAAQWEDFWSAHRDSLVRGDESVTWKNRELLSYYPFHQRPVRGDWLTALLASRLGEGSVADALRSAGLRLHLEPGRALLDGCGLTLARVAFVKRRSDGVGLVGLEMNRTQCRSTSDDFLVDPILVRGLASGGMVSTGSTDEGVGASGGPGQPDHRWLSLSKPPALDAFLVGAYCIEDELILLRRMHFPHGVAAGDVIALVNTGGYLMHILESASHQIPLARNVVRTQSCFEPDPIDDWSSNP